MKSINERVSSLHCHRFTLSMIITVEITFDQPVMFFSGKI